MPRFGVPASKRPGEMPPDRNKVAAFRGSYSIRSVRPRRCGCAGRPDMTIAARRAAPAGPGTVARPWWPPSTVASQVGRDAATTSGDTDTVGSRVQFGQCGLQLGRGAGRAVRRRRRGDAARSPARPSRPASSSAVCSSSAISSSILRRCSDGRGGRGLHRCGVPRIGQDRQRQLLARARSRSRWSTAIRPHPPSCDRGWHQYWRRTSAVRVRLHVDPGPTRQGVPAQPAADDAAAEVGVRIGRPRRRAV